MRRLLVLTAVLALATTPLHADTKKAPPKDVGFGRMINVSVRNPAFDVTPAELITGIVCEKGVVLNPNRESLATLLRV